MKLIIGLGNPGKQYNNTRHNIGFILLDEFAKTHNIEITKSKFNGLFIKTKINNEDVILLKPQSFMNLSGQVVVRFIDYFNIDLNNVLIISDDLDQEVGNFKLVEQGSSGGHNGLSDIEKHLSTRNYKRFKIGISNDKQRDTKDYVLGKLSKKEQEAFDNNLKTYIDLLNDYLYLDFAKLMAKYNRKGKNVK